MALSVVILAAGKGTRMKSAQPKVLHPIAGKPMLGHVIDCARRLQAQDIIVVIGHGADQIRDRIHGEHIRFVEQTEQLGTGHAVLQAMPHVPDGNDMLVLYGDVPLITAGTLEKVLEKVGDGEMGLLTVKLDNPTGYGRIVRNSQGDVLEIIEQKDASSEVLKIQEGNTGILAARASDMRQWLDQIGNQNAQGEYYLTDTIALCKVSGGHVHGVLAENEVEVSGVNDRIQLASLERAYQAKQAEQLMLSGVTLIDPSRLDIRGNLQAAQDVTIDINCVFEGNVELGQNVVIGPNCHITNSRIAANTVIKANSVIEDAVIGEGGIIGPFARIRPGTELAEAVHIGNFVEVKKSKVGQGSKINHLSYVGDSIVGKKVNIGAGTITCNYDGVNKHQTIIGDGAFIGSDSQLVAPVEIGEGATIGAGSTITKNTPPDQLTLSRSKQITVPSWVKPQKKS